MSDLGIMDYFLTKTDKNGIKVEAEMDISANYENPELMSSDFFDSILNLEKNNLDGCDLDSGLFNNLDLDMNLTSDGSVTYDDMQCETSTFSDSGLSSDLQEMPDQILSDDELLKSILDVQTNSMDETPQVPMQTVPEVVKPIEYVRPIVQQTIQNPPELEKQKIINIIKPKQVIRVQPLNGNSRSVLLPINIKDLKTIKIINTNNLKAENIKFTSATVRPNKKINSTEKFILKSTSKNGTSDELNNSTLIQRRLNNKQTSSTTVPVAEDASNDNDDETTGNQYPLLLLTAEEKRLLSKDGIQLPCRYPLTKHEERELKRIRRKIRNKISAQDSRKRKKEYVDGLEERVKQCSEENRSLLKRIKMLQLQNNKLSSQLSKLQALVFKTGTSRAHPATCLMIVLLSVMLVTLPNLRNNNGHSTVDKELNSLQQYVARRALLFSQQATNEDTVALNMDEFITFPAKKKSDDDDIIVDMLNEQKDSPKLDNIPTQTKLPIINYEFNVNLNDRGGGNEGDDTGGTELLKTGMKRYIEPDIDEHWPPTKKRNVSVATTGHANLYNRTEFIE